MLTDVLSWKMNIKQEMISEQVTLQPFTGLVKHAWLSKYIEVSGKVLHLRRCLKVYVRTQNGTQESHTEWK